MKLISYDAIIESGGTVLEAASAELRNQAQVLGLNIDGLEGETREEIEEVIARMGELAETLKGEHYKNVRIPARPVSAGRYLDSRPKKA